MTRPPCGVAPALDVEGLAAELERALPGRVERGLRVAELSTYRLGGPVAVVVRVGCEADLEPVAAAVARHAPPLLVIGRGSNLLVADTGFAGLGLVLDRELEALALPGGAAGATDAVVRAGAGLALPVLARRVAAAGLTGLEFFVGIPGSVGGAVRMNAGGHGRETRDVLVAARTCDLTAGGTVGERRAEDLALDYRHSALTPTEVVTGATFRVAPDAPAECEERVAEIVRWRREHQPGGANAGSVFRNPPGDAAGRLIDACGLKGYRVGGAHVSEKHANFFQADAGATAADVRRLVFDVRARVAAETGVLLTPELQMVGFDDDATGAVRSGGGE